MKISAYRKSLGDTVEMLDLWKHYDIVYLSKVFNMPGIRKIPVMDYFPNADSYVIGGSGFAITEQDGKEIYDPHKDLPFSDKLEHMYPDYDLYPEFNNTAYGFLTRGCPNNCGFCIVTKKEGCTKQTAELSEFWRGQNTIKLLDPNILSCDDRERLLQQLIDSKALIDYTQGLDARLIDDDIAELIAKTKIKTVHFAFDFIKNEAAIVRGLKIFKKHTTVTDRELKVYILTNYNTTLQEDWYRVSKVIELGYMPDVRIYRKGTEPRFLTDLARWTNNVKIFRSCPDFREYVPRVDGWACKELYSKILGGT
jgi:hypothetical protein